MKPAVAELRCPCGRRHVVDASPDAGVRWVDQTTVAERVGLPRRLYVEWCRTGRIEGARRAGRGWLAREAAVHAAIETLPSLAEPGPVDDDLADAAAACGLQLVGGGRR